MIAATGHDQNLHASPDLLLPQPALAAENGVVRRGQRFAQVQRARGPEAQLIQGAGHGYAATFSASTLDAPSGLAKHVSLHANRRAQPMQSRRIFSG